MRELNKTLAEYEAEKKAKKVSTYTPAVNKPEEKPMSQESITIASLTLYQLDHMSADEYRRYANNPEFRVKVNELETQRAQKYNQLVAQKTGVQQPTVVPDNPNNA